LAEFPKFDYQREVVVDKECVIGWFTQERWFVEDSGQGNDIKIKVHYYEKMDPQKLFNGTNYTHYWSKMMQVMENKHSYNCIYLNFCDNIDHSNDDHRSVYRIEIIDKMTTRWTQV